MMLRCRKCDREPDLSEDYHVLLEMCGSCAAEESPKSPWGFEQDPQESIPLVLPQVKLPPTVEQIIPYVTSTSSYANKNVQLETENTVGSNHKEFLTSSTKVVPLTAPLLVIQPSDHTPRPTFSQSTYWRTGEMSDIISLRTPLLTEFCRLDEIFKVNNIDEELIECAKGEELFEAVKEKIVKEMQATKCRQDAITLLHCILHDSERRFRFLRIQLKGQLSTWRSNGTIQAGHLGKRSYHALLRTHEKIFLTARGKVRKAVLAFSEKSVITASMAATVLHLSHRLFSTTWISVKSRVWSPSYETKTH